jgi:phytoene dehydrogenase-like protein
MSALTVPHPRFDAVVIGGGLAGHLAAVRLAKTGRSVALLERAKHPGGRAATTSADDIHFNLGPRALYCHGHAFRALDELKIPFSGRFPNPGTPLAMVQDRGYRLPATLCGLLLTRLLSPRDKWRFARLLGELPKLDTAGLMHTDVRTWATERYGDGALANLLFAFFRVTSYAADMEHYSAGAALEQLRLALEGNVWYVDGGWQSIIDGLRDEAVRSGVFLGSESPVASVRQTDDGLAIHVTRKETLTADSVVLAVGPEQAATILDLPDDHRLSQWIGTARPVRAACLDVALVKLPRQEHRFALGIDEPYYLSVHSAAAKLAPDGVAVVHVMKYLSNDESTSGVERDLEAFFDRAQPGWRKLVLKRRTLPNMLVAPDLPQAACGGLSGRPPVDVAGMPGVFVAGDWVGSHGQLADASAASADEATHRAIQFLETSPVLRKQYA